MKPTGMCKANAYEDLALRLREVGKMFQIGPLRMFKSSYLLMQRMPKSVDPVASKNSLSSPLLSHRGERKLGGKGA